MAAELVITVVGGVAILLVLAGVTYYCGRKIRRWLKKSSVGRKVRDWLKKKTTRTYSKEMQNMEDRREYRFVISQ